MSQTSIFDSNEAYSVNSLLKHENPREKLTSNPGETGNLEGKIWENQIEISPGKSAEREIFPSSHGWDLHPRNSRVFPSLTQGQSAIPPHTFYQMMAAANTFRMPSVVALCQAILNNASEGLKPQTSLGLATAQASPEPPPTRPRDVLRPTPTRPQVPAPMDVDQTPRQHPLLAVLHQHPAALQQGSFVKLTRPTASKNRPSDQNQISPETKFNSPTAASGKVVLDIAACDGPVFFERVLNKAYSETMTEDIDSDAEINVDELDSSDDDEEDESDKPNPNNRTVNMIKRPLDGGNCSSTTTYHCVYCNYTFKSHYCYQKHMRRHINPITVEMGPTATSEIASETPTSSSEVIQTDVASTSGERNILMAGNPILHDKLILEDNIQNSTRTQVPDNPTSQLGTSVLPKNIVGSGTSGVVGGKTMPGGGAPALDLNVQYFPCKTCGSKFPSYYFVHKHRRLVHGETGTAGGPSTDSSPHIGGKSPGIQGSLSSSVDSTKSEASEITVSAGSSDIEMTAMDLSGSRNNSSTN